MSISYNRKLIRIVLVILIAGVMLIAFSTPESLAASSKEYVSLSYAPVKTGNYYYKIQNGSVVRSKKKYSGYKTVLKNCPRGACVNNKYIYYVDVNWDKETAYFSRCTVASGKIKKLKKMPFNHEGLNYYYVNAVYKGNVYISRNSDVTKVYRYNIKSGKLHKMPANTHIEDRSGSFALAYTYESNGPGGEKWSLRKITSSGKLKKIKTLFTGIDEERHSKSFHGEFVGSVLYYAVTDTRLSDDINGDDVLESEDTIKIYRINRNGSKAKHIRTLKMEYNTVVVRLTSTYCDIYYYYDDYSSIYYDGVYRLYYKTGKLKKLSKSYIKKNYYYIGWE